MKKIAQLCHETCFLFSLPQLQAAGIRELEEEAGLKMTPDMCKDVPILAAWEV